MVAGALQRSLQVLQDLNISVVVVGEIALNYYNVPCMLYEIELCIRDSQLKASEHALDSCSQFQRLPQPDHDLYTAYKKDSPRFCYLEWRQTPIVLISEKKTKFDAMQIIGETAHNGQVFYSNDILGSLSVETIKRTPIPNLHSLIQYYCGLYLDSGDDMHRIRLEQLVDGMNVDRQWCEKNITDKTHSDLVVGLADSKSSRIDEFTGNLVTCFIPNQEDAKRVARIPGFDLTVGETVTWHK